MFYWGPGEFCSVVHSDENMSETKGDYLGKASEKKYGIILEFFPT